MSECADQEHYMGVITFLNGSLNVWNNKLFAKQSMDKNYMGFDFCPNCGKELKEFYKEDE